MSVTTDEIRIPLKLTSEANCSMHWTKKNKRHQLQKQIVGLFLITNKISRKLPCHIILTRESPRFYDDDNLVPAFKYIRDKIADHFIPGKRPGIADSDPRLTWEYKQEKSKEEFIKIQFIY